MFQRFRKLMSSQEPKAPAGEAWQSNRNPPLLSIHTDVFLKEFSTARAVCHMESNVLKIDTIVQQIATLVQKIDTLVQKIDTLDASKQVCDFLSSP